jgi:hypothetical protein
MRTGAIAVPRRNAVSHAARLAAFLFPALLFGVSSLAPAQARAQAVAADQSWCEDHGASRPSHCEVRELTLAAPSELRVDAAPNGGISVEAWDGPGVHVLARVVAQAADRTAAAALVGQVRVGAEGGQVQADGPRRPRGGWYEDQTHWSVSYRIRVPRTQPLRLSSVNGGIGVRGVESRMELQTTNGGIALRDVGGDVRSRTTNGGITVELAGTAWRGAGLDARTTNGGVRLRVPEGFSAELEAGTTNGGVDVDFPVMVQGRLNRSVRATLGSGGAPIRLRTTNGGVRISRG